MEKTSDKIINEQFDSLDPKVSSIPDSDNSSIRSMSESIKKNKQHDKATKHRKYKKSSKRSKKKKCHSRSNSPDDYIELELKKDKLEEAKSSTPVPLDVVMETIVTKANEKNDEVKDTKCDKNEDGKKDETTVDNCRVQTPEKDIKETSNIFLLKHNYNFK